MEKLQLMKKGIEGLTMKEQQALKGGALDPVTVGMAAVATLDLIYNFGVAVGKELYHVTHDK